MQLQELSAGNFGAFREFAESAWRRPKSDAYYDWRYFKAPGLRTVLGMEGARCVAAISAFERNYRDGDAVVSCLEPFDWFTLPEARRGSAGVRVMRSLFAAGKPVVGFGGSRYTAKIYPKHGTTAAAMAREFFLPLSGAYLLRNRTLPLLAKMALEPLLNRAAAVWFTPTLQPRSARLELVSIGSRDAIQEVDGIAGFRTVPDPKFFDWLEDGARLGTGTGSYLRLGIRSGSQLLAWSFSRLHRSAGLLRAAILDVRLAQADSELAQCIVRGTARTLAAAGADHVRTLSSCPFISSAFRAAGFLQASEDVPATVWWSAGPSLGAQGIAVSSMADSAFMPLH